MAGCGGTRAVLQSCRYDRTVPQAPLSPPSTSPPPSLPPLPPPRPLPQAHALKVPPELFSVAHHAFMQLGGWLASLRNVKRDAIFKPNALLSLAK